MTRTTYAPGLRRTPTARTWLGLGAGLFAVLVLLVLIVVACAGPDRPQAGAPDPTPSATGTGGLAAAPGDEDTNGGATGAEDGGAAGGDAPDTGTEGQPAPPVNQGGESQPEPAGPAIEQFQVVQQPQCPGGTTEHTVEAQPVTLAWTVTGADGDQVSLSIDGPGVYQTYPADGGDVINFPCEGEEGDIQEHTYLLTAEGDGVTVTATLVVTAKVQQVTDV
jgi:hypothetical protein